MVTVRQARNQPDEVRDLPRRKREDQEDREEEVQQPPPPPHLHQRTQHPQRRKRAHRLVLVHRPSRPELRRQLGRLACVRLMALALWLKISSLRTRRPCQSPNHRRPSSPDESPSPLPPLVPVPVQPLVELSRTRRKWGKGLTLWDSFPSFCRWIGSFEWEPLATKLYNRKENDVTINEL